MTLNSVLPTTTAVCGYGRVGQRSRDLKHHGVSWEVYRCPVWLEQTSSGGHQKLGQGGAAAYVQLNQTQHLFSFIPLDIVFFPQHNLGSFFLFFFFKSSDFNSIWLCWLLVVAHGLSCSLAYGPLVLRPGIEPMSPALQGGFLTTGPPREVPNSSFS